jgi:DNA polymerase III delta prime subunit
MAQFDLHCVARFAVSRYATAKQSTPFRQISRALSSPHRKVRVFKKIILTIFMFLSCLVYASDEDYLQARMDLAKSNDYQPYPLYAMHIALLEEHYKLGADPEKSIDEINKPLQQLSDIYPIGVQVNNAIAGFLEYVAGLSEDKEQAEGLLRIAEKKRSKASEILNTILDSGDGNSLESAYKVINLIEEDAVLEHYELTKVSQSVLEVNSLHYDELVVKDKSGKESKVFFEISLFYKDE